ncbi:MAG: sulfatase [Armatimonadetes bacterium]|nr:sulfatase [Armatimonadota bacterium]
MTEPRNILLVFVDSLRADHLGCYGYHRPTSPNIDRLASEGAVCERFFAPAVPTQPSFTTVYTGQHSLTHGVVSHKGGAQGDNDLKPGTPWFPALLRQAGFLTASFDCLPRYKSWFVHGFEFLVDSTFPGPDDGYSCERLNTRVLPWLRTHCDERFFAAIHYWDPHTPYLPPERFRCFYEGDPTDPSRNTLAPLADQYFSVMWRKWFEKLPPGMCDAEYVVALYDGEICHADEGVGQVLQTLQECGHAEDTLVILLSDHGEMHYRHDIFFDHHGLYDGNIRCPLIVRWPGVVEPGTRVTDFAQHVDVAPTILSAFDLDVPPAMEGQSLVPLLTGSHTPLRDFITSQECTWQAKWAIRDDTHKLILARLPDLHGNPTRELYDLRTDPDELHNLADQQPDLARTLEERLEAWIAAGMAKNGLTEDPVATHGISLGKAWEEWIAKGRPREG